jgi:hypothetical protein
MLDDVLGERRKKLEGLKAKTASTNPDYDDAASPSTSLSTESSVGAPSSTAPGKENNSELILTIPKMVDYSRLDISKAKRLIKARESSVKSVTTLIEKEEERLS